MVVSLRRVAALTLVVSLLFVSLGGVCQAADAVGSGTHDCCPASIQAVDHCHSGSSGADTCCAIQTPPAAGSLPSAPALSGVPNLGSITADARTWYPDPESGWRRGSPPPVSPPALRALRTTVLLI
ncbi:MAG: hypothetical protein IT185_06800 [Acidobacteria bacterium]|nr:hypothetical protein [Acidobacteriota bacterium]